MRTSIIGRSCEQEDHLCNDVSKSFMTILTMHRRDRLLSYYKNKIITDNMKI